MFSLALIARRFSWPLRLAVLPLLATLAMALVPAGAQADSTYNVEVCGNNAVAGQTSPWSDFIGTGATVASCSLTTPNSGGTDAAGNFSHAIFSAPANESISSVLWASAHFWSGGNWSAGLATNISSNTGTYYAGVHDCSSNSTTHLYTWNGAASSTACNNNGVSGGLTGPFSSVGLILVCNASTCSDTGNSGATIGAMTATIDDSWTTPAISDNGSLWSAANGNWVNGHTAGTSDSLSYSATDPGTVCSLTAYLVDANGIGVSGAGSTAYANWDGSAFTSAQPCASNPSGTLTPNLAALPTGTYHVNVASQNPGQYAAGTYGYAQGATWTDGPTLKVDNSVPTGSLSASGNASTWYPSAQTVTVSASDVGSGLKWVTCSGPGAPGMIPPSQLPYTIHVTQNGTDTISCSAMDEVGNTASLGSATLHIDSTVPTVAINSSLNSGTWYPSAASIPAVNVTSTSGPSGISTITCQAPDAPNTLTAASGTLDLSTLRDGAGTISCTPMSAAGVTGAPASLLVQLDSQTPTLTFAGRASETKWYSAVGEIPELDTDATAGPSGLASIGCSGDGIASQSATVSGAAVDLAGLGQGTGAVTCTATSVSGRTSSPQTFALNLDSGVPSAAWSTSESETAWYPSTAAVPALALTSTAGGPSGVDHITCSGDGITGNVTVAASGAAVHPTGFADEVNTLSCVPYSGAGVSGPAISRTILVDSTRPAVALSGTDSSTWYPSAQTLGADASSATDPSGVQSVSCSVDGNPATVTSGAHATQTVSGDGTHTATCQALSGAGVTGPAASTAVRIDTQLPMITQTVTPAAASDPAGTVAVLVTGSEASSLSGLASTSCSLDHQPATVVSGAKQTIAVTSAGLHTLDCSATTRAGVTGSDSTQTYTVTADPSQFSLQYGTVSSDWQSGPVTVPVQLTGATASDYSSLTCTVDGAHPTSISGTSGTVAVTGSGSQQVACYAIANNGASTAARTQTVKIDTQTPTGAWSTTSTPTGARVTLMGSEPTPLSGIASESCSVDGASPQTSSTPNLTVAVTGNGTHQLSCTITSGAGVSAHVSHSVNVTVAVPAPLTVSAPDPDRWYAAAQRIVLGIPTGGPTITAVRCTQAGAASSYPVSGPTVTVPVDVPGGDVRCLDVDDAAQQSASVDFPVHIDTGSPTGYFTQTGPGKAIASISNPGASGIQSVSVQYRIGSGAWVTLPGGYDAASGQIAVALPGALRQPGVQYTLQAIAVNDAGGRSVIATMQNGAPATGAMAANPTAPSPYAGAAASGGLYVGTMPPGGRLRVAKMVPRTRKVTVKRNGKTVVRVERVYRIVARRATVRGRRTVRRVKVPVMRRIYVWQINTAALAHTLTVAYGQTVSLAATLTLTSGQVGGQTATIVQGTGSRRRLTATTNAAGSFNVALGAGASRTVTYTIAGVSHTVTIRVRGKLAVAVRGGAAHRTLALVAAGATGRVTYRLQQYRAGRWRALGKTRQTNRFGRATVRLPRTLASTSPSALRVLISSQRTWQYLSVQQPTPTPATSSA